MSHSQHYYSTDTSVTTSTMSVYDVQTTDVTDDDVDYEYDYDFIRMTPTFQIPSAVGISVLIFFAIGGNVLTIVSFTIDKKLRTVYDFYIFNLAVTDLLIGCVSMPFYAVYTLKEFQWDYGVTFCKFWLTVDFTLCSESVILIVLLSYDRLLLVIHGPQYTAKVTVKQACVKLAVSWLLAFLLYGPAIIGWNYWVGYSTVEDLDCDVEFAHNFLYTTICAVVEFVIPVVGLAVLNYLIYRKIRNRFIRHGPNGLGVGNRQCTVSTVVPDNGPSHYNSTNGTKQTVNDETRVTAPEKSHTRIKFDVDADSTASDTKKTSFLSLRRRASKRKETNSRVKRESKAARVLAVLVLVFLTCWAPYTVITIIVSFCEDHCDVNLSFYESMNWLLWGKSAINPLMYAYNSARYRYNFRRILLCWRKQGQVFPSTFAETTNHTLHS